MNGQNILAALTNRLPTTLDVHLQEVIHGASVAFVIKIAGTVLAFLLNVVLARLLGADGAGVYYLALTIVTIASLLGKVGLDNALVRFTAASAANGSWAKVTALARKGIRLSALISGFVTVAVILLAPWLSTTVFDEPRLTLPLRLMAFAIVPFSLLSLNSALLRGLKRIRDSTVVRAFAVPFLSLPLLLLLGPVWVVEGAVIAYFLATGAVWLLSVFAWNGAVPNARSNEGQFDTRLLVTTSVPLLLIEILSYSMSSSSTLLLGIWLDSEAVGIFGIAVRTTLLMRFVLESTNSIVAPKFAALYELNDIGALATLMRNISIVLAIVAAPIVIIFLVMPNWIMSMFGSDFADGALALAILAVGQYVNVATGSVGQLLMMTGHEKALRNNVLVTAVLNLVLNVWLIPVYGLVGAAIANSVTLAMQNLITVYLVKRYLSITLWPLNA